MAYDYATFLTDLSTLITIPSTDTDLLTMMPRILEAAEDRCLRDLQPIAARKTQTANFGNVASVGAAAALLALPSDCVAAERLDYFSSGTVRVLLEFRRESYLSDYWPDRAVSGAPKYWALTTFGTVLIAPTPSSPYGTELTYTSRPTSLYGLGNGVYTWLSQYAPDLLLYAALVFTAGYQKNYGSQADDSGNAMSWEKQYQLALKNAKAEEALRRVAGSAEMWVPAAA